MNGIPGKQTGIEAFLPQKGRFYEKKVLTLRKVPSETK